MPVTVPVGLALNLPWQLIENATTYEAWLAAAERLDELEGVWKWKQDPSSPHYDSRLIQERLTEMKRVCPHQLLRPQNSLCPVTEAGALCVTITDAGSCMPST